MIPNDRLNKILLVVTVVAFFLAPIFQDNFPLFTLWIGVGLITLALIVARFLYYRFGMWYFLPILFVITFLTFLIFRRMIISWLCWSIFGLTDC
jgi:hypothetical protein